MLLNALDSFFLICSNPKYLIDYVSKCPVDLCGWCVALFFL